jgi:hypothetical protein
MPPALARRSGHPRVTVGDSSTLQELTDRFGPFELLQLHATQLATNPTLQLTQQGSALRITEVRDPAREEAVQFADHLLDLDASISTSDLPDAILDTLHTLGRNAQLPATQETVAEKLAFLDVCHCTFLPIDTEPEHPFQELIPIEKREPISIVRTEPLDMSAERTTGPARTPDGLNARSFFAWSNFEVQDVA